MGERFHLWILGLDDTWFLGQLVFPHMGWVLLATVVAGFAAAFLAGGRLRFEYAVSCAMEVFVIKVAHFTAIAVLVIPCLAFGTRELWGRPVEVLCYSAPVLLLLLILFKEWLFRGNWSKPTSRSFHYDPPLAPRHMVRKNGLLALSGLIPMAVDWFQELATGSDIQTKTPDWLWPLLIEIALLIFFLDMVLGIGLRLSGVRLVAGPKPSGSAQDAALPGDSQPTD